MAQRFRGLHPASVIVFLIGVVFGITGVTLAIVFGVKCELGEDGCRRYKDWNICTFLP